MSDKNIAKADEPKAIHTLSPLIQMAMDKDFDVEKLSAFLAVQKEWEANEAKKAFSLAMSECQKKMPMIVKTAFNEQTRSLYAKHEMICKLIKPVYTEHGFSLSFSQGKADIEGEIRTLCDMDHGQGHSKHYHIDLPRDDGGIKGNVNKTPIHAKGSTFSYGRRYLTMMIFDLATYDDNDAATRPESPRLSEDQQTEILDLITEVKADKHKFYKHFKINDLSTIPACNYKVLVDALEAKRGKA